MKKRLHPKVVLIDLFGTLVPSSIDFSHVRKLACNNKVPVKRFKDLYDRLLLTQSFHNPKEAVALFCRQFQTPKNDCDNLVQYLGGRWSGKDNQIQFFPEVERTLKQLQKRGYLLALVSNAESFVQHSLIDRLPIQKYFSCISLSFQLHSVKPEPRLFEFALSELNALPKEAVMVGDTKRTDILGAKRLGIKTIWVNRGKVQHGRTKPDYTIHHLDELLKLLK